MAQINSFSWSTLSVMLRKAVDSVYNPDTGRVNIFDPTNMQS